MTGAQLAEPARGADRWRGARAPRHLAASAASAIAMRCQR